MVGRMSCDLCGKASADLRPLLAVYATSSRKAICPACDEALRKHQLRILSKVIPRLMKRKMNQLSRHPGA